MLDLMTISPRLVLRVSPRARRLTLRLDPQARCVRLIVPRRASMKLAYRFADQNRAWIAEKLATLPEPIPFADGAVLPVLGEDLTLHIRYDPSRRSTRITREADRLIVETNLENPGPRIARDLKARAESAFGKIAHEKAGIIGRRIRRLRYRDMKSRWGSCSKDGDMSLNWRLIFSPIETYDYVIAHEVAHLVHGDHGPAFWRLCESLSFDYANGKAWIRDNAVHLTRYGMTDLRSESVKE
jgi:predicted metal-dependent hydrolase